MKYRVSVHTAQGLSVLMKRRIREILKMGGKAGELIRKMMEQD